MSFKRVLKECGDKYFIIQPSLFEITKPFIYLETTYCQLNEIKLKHFLKKFHKFTENSFKIVKTSSNINHCFTWSAISNAPKMLRRGRT